MTDFDVIVAGAGAVGLAVAAAGATRGHSVLVLEAGPGPGQGISSRNSEVIHAGLYYPTGSLKHRLSIRGRHMLYAFLEAAHLPFRKCGKIVVATSPDELGRIEALAGQAAANGVEGVRLIGAGDVHALEPEVVAHGAVLSPETGIFDSHAYMLALVARIEDAGGLVVCRAPVIGAVRVADHLRVSVGGAEPAALTTRLLVNAAGLDATALAAKIEGLAPEAVPRLWLAKGNYFALSRRAPFSRLVYPAPVSGGLGVHATLDLAGRARFGPDVEWLAEGIAPERVDYAVDPGRAGSFYLAIRRYWPGLGDGELVPDYSGVRPKLVGPGEAAADFSIQTETSHGLAGLVNLFGIESPGLTASLAIAEYLWEQPEIAGAIRLG